MLSALAVRARLPRAVSQVLYLMVVCDPDFSAAAMLEVGKAAVRRVKDKERALLPPNSSASPGSVKCDS